MLGIVSDANCLTIFLSKNFRTRLIDLFKLLYVPDGLANSFDEKDLLCRHCVWEKKSFGFRGFGGLGRKREVDYCHKP